jgi:hypothetical protein
MRLPLGRDRGAALSGTLVTLLPAQYDLLAPLCRLEHAVQQTLRHIHRTTGVRVGQFSMAGVGAIAAVCVGGFTWTHKVVTSFELINCLVEREKRVM